jgi:hypothetical protein
MSPRQFLEKTKKEKVILDRRLELTKRCIGLLGDVTDLVQQTNVTDVQMCLAILVKISAVQLLQLNSSLQEGEEQAVIIDDFIRRSESSIVTPSMMPPSGVR